MLGAIAGDIIGSVYEHSPVDSIDFDLFPPGSRFTDDSVLSVAVAEAILSDGDYRTQLLNWGLRYPRAGYGRSFHDWLHRGGGAPYNSWGNGSAMRVAPVGWAFDNEHEVLEQARASAAVTHDHAEGIKGAQATALAVFMARQGQSMTMIKARISEQFGYDLSRSLAEIRPDYGFDVSCQGSVPEAIIAFLESDDYEGAVRNAVSLGGDADTQACIAGGIAEAFYGEVPADIVEQAEQRLPEEMRDVIRRFEQWRQSRQ